MVSACGVSRPDSGDSVAHISKDTTRAVHLAVFLQSTANTYFQADLAGARKVASEAGGVTVHFFDGGFSASQQDAQIQDAVTSGKYNAFVVFPNDGSAVVPYVKQAVAKKIPVVAAYVPIGDNIAESTPQVPGVVGTVWHNEPEDGMILAQAAIKACAVQHPNLHVCRIGYISGGNSLPYEAAKFQQFKKTIAGDHHQKLIVVSEQQGNFLRDTARTAAENMLQADRDINVMATTGDQMTLGAQDAVQSAGLTGKVSLLGDGASAQGVAAVKQHRWFSTNVYLPFTEGERAATMAIQAARGQKISPDVINVRKLSPVGPLYTQQTTKPFKAQWHA